MICVLLSQCLSFVEGPDLEPLVIGDSFILTSTELTEDRRINVYTPPEYSESKQSFPVIYMPDGGMGEDFPHIAGLVSISALNGTMRPFILVGIENTQRKRDLTGPTSNAEDAAIAPLVGESQNFRRFIRKELIPVIETTYRTTDERAIVGESLAGLFVVETLMLEPDLFQAYIAVDPSLWWNDAQLAKRAPHWVSEHADLSKQIYFATSSTKGFDALVNPFSDNLKRLKGSTVHYLHLPQETHSSVYLPAATKAFRTLFRPDP